MVTTKTFKLSWLVLALVICVWSIYRLITLNSIEVDEYLFKPLIWLIPCVIAVFVFEKNKLSSLGFTRPNLKYIFLAALAGFAFAGERLLTIYLKDGHLTSNPHHMSLNSIIFTPLITALVEETFFRGYLLNRWLGFFKQPIIPIIINAIIFTSTHLPYVIFQLHYSGTQLMFYLFSNFISGLIDVLIFYKTRQTVASTTNHFIWNFFSSLFT